MTLFVVDASALGPLLIADEAESLSSQATDLILSSSLLVPRHWHFEIANMVLVAIRRGRATDLDRSSGFRLLGGLSMSVDATSQEAAWAETFDLAVAEQLTLYDAAYLELARRTASPLLTLDTDLSRAANRRDVATPLGR